MKKSVEKTCQVWPGIELDVSGSGCSRAHLIVVANPDSEHAFSSSVDLLVGTADVDTCVFPIKSVVKVFEECDPIYIPHFHGKDPAFPESLIAELESLIVDSARLFRELSDYRSLGVYANHDYSVIIGSDNHDWDVYEKCTFADLRLEVSNYNQFCLLAKKDVTVVNSLLNVKRHDTFLASPHPDIKIPLEIYRDINVLFGQKGTGKSEILNSIRKTCEKNGIKYSQYIGTGKESEFEKLLSTDDLTRDCRKLDIYSFSQEFRTILDWKDKQPERFQNYILWQETKDKNKNKKRMKITDADALPKVDSKKKTRYKQDYETVSSLLEGFRTIKLLEYMVGKEVEQIQSLLSCLKKTIFSRYVDEWIAIESTNLTNKSLSIIKQTADSSTESKSKPASTGFEEYGSSRLDLIGAVNSISQAFDTAPFSENEYIGDLDGKGAIFIQTRLRLLCEDSDRTEYNGNITKLKSIRQKIVGVSKRICDKNLPKWQVELKDELEEAGVSSLSNFVGLKKTVVDKNIKQYSPSNGEKGILMLQRTLSEQADFYILDEPELGMGNSYINNTILPQIINLSKAQKAIIIATHNANIAVRTLPYMTIYRTHKNGEYRTYVGNPFTDRLVNIGDASDTMSWTIESMKTLEGGKEAFYERKTIYESGETGEDNQRRTE